MTRDDPVGEAWPPPPVTPGTSLEGIPMRTARLAVTADALGVSQSCAHHTRSEGRRSAPSTSPSRELSADRAAISAPDAPPWRPATRRTARQHTARPSAQVWPPAGGVRSGPRRAGGKTTSMRPPPHDRSEQSSGTRHRRRGPRVREQILVKPAVRDRSGRSPWRPHRCPHTSYSVSPARRSAILQRTKNGCNTNASGTITYPIAIREVLRTRCKSPLFDAEWLARILFAGRGYLERGR